MAGKKLGIYFGKDSISIVEVAGTQVTSSAHLSLPEPGELQGAPGESRQITLIGDGLKENKIEAKKAFLGLSNKEQFIRGFQMLVLSKSEMDMGVLYEVKKYLPFKTDDLIFDYQHRINKGSSKMDILFVAVTKNGLDSNLAILNQAGLQITAVEPASFALLRVLALTKQLNPKASFALVTLEGADVEFTIIDRGFPCFSRDIKLSAAPAIPEGSGPGEAAEVKRLASEIRVSLDYFRRQFSGSPVDKVLFLSKMPMPGELISGLNEDLGLLVERVELERNKEANGLEDLGLLKAYALALKDKVKINLSVDLTRKKYVQPALEEAPKEIKPAVLNIAMIKWPLILSLGLLAMAYIFPQFDINQANSRLNQLSKEVEGILPVQLRGAGLEALNKQKTDYADKLAILQKLVNSRFNLTPSLNAIPAALNQGLWLENISIILRDGLESLSLRGAVYLGEKDAELNAANSFYQKLKSSPDFMRGLRILELKSISEGQVQVGSEKYLVTYFDISGG